MIFQLLRRVGWFLIGGLGFSHHWRLGFLVGLRMENVKVRAKQFGLTKPISYVKPTDFDIRRSFELEKVCDLLFRNFIVVFCLLLSLK